MLQSGNMSKDFAVEAICEALSLRKDLFQVLYAELGYGCDV